MCGFGGVVGGSGGGVWLTFIRCERVVVGRGVSVADARVGREDMRSRELDGLLSCLVSCSEG